MFGIVSQLAFAIGEMGIPFQKDTEDLFKLDTKVVASAASVQLIKQYYENGHAKFEGFLIWLLDDRYSF